MEILSEGQLPGVEGGVSREEQTKKVGAEAVAVTGVSVTIERIPTGNWQDDANCLGVDPDLFFPERGASTREAKEVCRGCVARVDCLEYAMTNGEKFGIWGGLSERERRRMRRQRAQAARIVTA